MDMEATQPQLELGGEALVDVLLPGVQPKPHRPRMPPVPINIVRIVVLISLGGGRAASQGDETCRYHRTPMIPDQAVIFLIFPLLANLNSSVPYRTPQFRPPLARRVVRRGDQEQFEHCIHHGVSMSLRLATAN